MVSSLWTIAEMKTQITISAHQLTYMQNEIDEFQANQQHLNDKQDAELQSYWDNLELRIGELQRMQFDACRSSKN